MELARQMVTSGEAAPAERGHTSPDGQLAQEATKRMFRSVRAGRNWVRTRDASTTVRQLGACVAMKPGSGEPPVFLIPGAPGSVLQLGPLAAAMPISASVYAIRPRGLEAGEQPYESIEDMAAYGIDAIRSIHPEGPYLLVGYSTGGLVALEMARQLFSAGEQVPLVVLMDIYPSRQLWSLRCHMEILVRQAIRMLWLLRWDAPVQAAREAVRRIKGLSGYLAASGVKALPLPPIVPKAWSEASRQLYLASVNAAVAYRPPSYSGRVVFIQPSEIPDLEPRLPGRVWSRFLPDMEVHQVPGSHLGMVEAGAAVTAKVIGERLVQALPAINRSVTVPEVL